MKEKGNVKLVYIICNLPVRFNLLYSMMYRFLVIQNVYIKLQLHIRICAQCYHRWAIIKKRINR